MFTLYVLTLSYLSIDTHASRTGEAQGTALLVGQLQKDLSWENEHLLGPGEVSVHWITIAAL